MQQSNFSMSIFTIVLLVAVFGDYGTGLCQHPTAEHSKFDFTISRFKISMPEKADTNKFPSPHDPRIGFGGIIIETGEINGKIEHRILPYSDKFLDYLTNTNGEVRISKDYRDNSDIYYLIPRMVIYANEKSPLSKKRISELLQYYLGTPQEEELLNKLIKVGKIQDEKLSEIIVLLAVEFTKEGDDFIVSKWLPEALLHESINKTNSPHADIKETLLDAARDGNTETVKALLANGADVNAKSNDGVTALMIASHNNHYDIVKALLAKDVDVNMKNNKNGWTALMFAAQDGYADIVKILLAHVADVNARSFSGVTALIIASANGQTEIVKILLANGADVNAKSNDGVTALMYSSENGHIEIVKTLLSNNADVNVKSIKDGTTALMVVSANGQTEIVKILLANGADVNAQHKDGTTALMYATHRGFLEIVKILKEAGAEE